jgi:hypothetical protein
MSTKTAAALRFTLSGPGTDKGYETAGAAISAGITAAEKLRKTEGTFYVRDSNGEVVGKVEHDAKGRTFAERVKFIGAVA